MRFIYVSLDQSFQVDGDPHGFEIFSSYKYGSISMAWCAEELSVMDCNWLGTS